MNEATAKKARGRARAALTRIINSITDISNLGKYDLMIRIEKVESAYVDFDKADAELDEHLSEMEDFEKKYYETKVKLQDALDKYSCGSFVPIVNNTDNQMQTTNSNFKLPQINIQSFTGKYNDWPSFKDLYVSLVHANVTISNVQKFQYLKGLLTDEPAIILKHIPVSETGYIQAWEKLLARYDKKNQIISSLIKTFLDQPNMPHTSACNLRNIADTSDEVIRGLKALGGNATSRDVWLIYILLQKVDLETRKSWAQTITDDEFPTFEKFLEFLNTRCASLEMYNENDFNEKREKTSKFSKSRSNSTIKCIKCRGNHLLYKCYKFKELSVKERKQFVRKSKLCTNCLSDKHADSECNSAFTCHFCKQMHHSILCEHNSHKYAMSAFNPNQNAHSSHETGDQFVVPAAESNYQAIPNVSINTTQSAFALLPTACLLVKDSTDHSIPIRALLDSGSQGTFITEACANMLGITRKNARYPISGLADSQVGITKGSIELEVISQHGVKNELLLTAFILNKLTAPLPAEKIKEEDFQHLKNLQLADPHFYIPNKIDVIIGSDYFFSLLLPGQVVNSQNKLIAQNSIFGFLVSGKLPNTYAKPNSPLSLNIYELNIDKELKRFWEMEEILNTQNEHLTPEEQFCETHFQENFSVNTEGRFVVKLPIYKSNMSLGDSKPAAVSRLHAMERKFRRDPEFEKRYKAFIREYEQLGHMALIDQNLPESSNETYYLPHHAVFKPSSTTTKLRVVFDASCKTTNGISLNTILGVGPKLQRDIFEILLNFRVPRIVFTADIEKMYRQIIVAPDDQDYQRIFWRYNENDAILAYKLKTVTYGCSSASFLATRCLKQTALDCKDPDTARILLEDVYMDDLLSGSDTVDEAILTCKKISSTLQARGFNLRKWNSNSAEFRNEFKEHCSQHSDLEITPSESSKVLGLFWNSSADMFNFKAALQVIMPLTKRRILAESARIFDPLGLLSPCIVLIKIFYQKLWLTNGDWDSPIPQPLADEWLKFQESFYAINDCQIPRCVAPTTNCVTQLHGFCDASTLAYAAAIYCRCEHNGVIQVNLLVSKTKVAPIKQVSIPRLELAAAHLLAKLFRSVLSTLKTRKFEVFAWTDSKVVLAWLSAHPRKWKTFVANRTSQIIEVIPTKHWNHVPSKENPADIASRGIEPKLLPQCKLWWTGPDWLKQEETSWPKKETKCEDESEVQLEQRSDPMFTFHTQESYDFVDNLFERYSSISKIFRILAYCQRFISNCKRHTNFQTPSDINIDYSVPLTFLEIKSTEQIIVRWIQNVHFSKELKCIENGKPLAKKSQLRSLHPFKDENGLLRVGGRLQNSSLAFSAKHPVILPAQHKFCELLIKDRHITYMHAGPTALSHIIRQSYWIIGGKRLIQRCIKNCLTCHRFKTAATPQMMGNLPDYRVTLQRPFYRCGVDFAGPISVKFSKGRGAKTTKGYIALFICLSTKAVHIEAVSDLTADSFIAALRRFSARRGAPGHMYSDNGTNFVGARRKLNEFHQHWLSLPTNESVSHHLIQSSIEWHMIPPASPHFGGIWEAGIRSAKFHLKRVLGETLLTFEELTTFLAQIEAILNSRPLTWVNSSDIDSINVLTPSHFLTGDILTTVPDSPAGSLTANSRWELLQSFRRGFWNRWQNEYLSSLQQRPKWPNPRRNLAVDDIVLIREDGTPPLSWPLGRIIAVHPGKDGFVRVATVKTQRGTFKRPTIKLSPLPLYQD